MSLEVYGALLLHKAGKEINEGNLKRILEAAGAKVDDMKLKALVASLDDINIEDAIKQAAVAPVSASAPAGSGEKKSSEEKPREEKKDAEEAAAGLSSLFG